MLNYHFPSHNTVFLFCFFFFFCFFRLINSITAAIIQLDLSLNGFPSHSFARPHSLQALRLNVNVMSCVTLFPCCFLQCPSIVCAPSSNASHSTVHSNTHILAPGAHTHDERRRVIMCILSKLSFSSSASTQCGMRFSLACTLVYAVG